MSKKSVHLEKQQMLIQKKLPLSKQSNIGRKYEHDHILQLNGGRWGWMVGKILIQKSVMNPHTCYRNLKLMLSYDDNTDNDWIIINFQREINIMKD